MSAVEGWKRQKLKEVAALNYGKDLSAIVDIAGNIPIHGTSEDVRWGRDYLYDGASVILGRKGSIDRVKYVEGKFWTIDTAYYLSDFDDALPKWLYYFLSTIDLRALNEATGVPSLSRDRLYMIEVPKPPLIEQAKIAEILSTVDRAIEQTEALIAKQQRIKTGLMADLLTRGIDPDGNLRSEATHAFKDSPLGRIPVEWECSNMGAYTVASQGLQIPIEHRFKEWAIGRYQYITVQYLNNPVKYSEFIQSPRLQLVCSEEDILFTRTGNTGQIVTDVCGVFHNNFFKVSFDKLSLRKAYLAYFLRWKPIQEIIKDLAGTTTIPDMNHGDFYSMPLLLPPITEQKQISNILDEHCRFVSKAESQLSKLQALKTALMQDLLTGKVRVTPLLEKEVPA